MSPFDAFIVAAQINAARTFESRDIPSRARVEAIIDHESRGFVRRCRNEADGSSSRGLMQINRKRSRCGIDDARFAADFDPRQNIRLGVYLLALQSEWCRKHRHTGHDPLYHYAGKGKAALRFVVEILEIEGKAAR